jgi:WD40 repeat protein
MNVAPTIPDHTLLHPIGRGAYGEVWLARNVMGAPRAVKIIWRRQFDSARPYEREFAGIQRYEPVSRTTDGLVQVLHVGQNEKEGYFYCVMELADDAARVISEPESPGVLSLNTDPLITDYSPRTLRSDVKRLGRLPMADSLQVALDVVSGLARLHQHGLVHRDVKPGNIIFVNGRAKLADIGLVSVGGEARTFVGTEGYIPPEGPGTPRADIYALGMCLYEASTGHSPDRFPNVPTEWFSPEADPQPLEFQEIVLKACEGARDRRYQSAEQLRADLALLQSGQSVRRMRALERRVARLRGLGVAAVLTAVLAVGAVLLANYRTRLETESRSKELALRRRAEVAENDATRQLYAALVREAHATVHSREMGHRVLALEAVRRAAEITNTVELRREAFAALALPDLRFERQLPAEPDWTMMSLDPEFERIAIGRGERPVEVRSVSDQRLLATLPASTTSGATFGKWSSDGRFLAVCRPRPSPQIARDLEVWDVSSERRRLFVVEAPWDAFSFHPTKPRILCPSLENWIVLYDLEDGRELKRFSAAGNAHHVNFSPDGRVFIVQHRIGGSKRRGGAEWYTSVYDVDTGATLSSVITGWIDGMAWHPQGRWIAFATRAGEVHLHDRKTGETHVLGRHKSEARTAVFSPDGGYLFTGGEEQEIICWDLRSTQRAFTAGLQSQSLQFRTDGEQCAVPTRSGVLLHRFERAVPCREMRGDLGGGVNRGVISSNGRWLAAAGTDRLGLWDLSADAPPAMATNLFNPATPMFGPDGSELVFFWREGIVRWRIAAGAEVDAAPQVTALPIHQPGRLYYGGFSRDTVVLGTLQGPVLLQGAALATGPGELMPIANTKARISPNGSWLAFQNRFPPGYQFYGMHPWRELRFEKFDSEVLSEAFTARDDELAVATYTSVTFLDTNRWKPQRRFNVALDRNAQIVFMPDGKAFWLAYDARTAALHDSRTFETLLPLPAGTLPLAVSPDGRHLAVGVEARRVQVWDLAEVRKAFRELGLSWYD